MSESEKCDYEIARYETALRGGHPEMEGLLQALQDWSAEKRLLQESHKNVSTDGL